MRFYLPILAAACGLLASCSSSKIPGGYTSGDIANLRLRDLNPLAKNPPIVQAQQSTLREISAERASFWQRRFAWFRKPVDYKPPTLPDGALAFDGSLLPAKPGSEGGSVNVGEILPGSSLAANSENENGFSIE